MLDLLEWMAERMRKVLPGVPVYVGGFGEDKKKMTIVAMVDGRTCDGCLAADRMDPEVVGYPPFHEPNMKGEGGCRCVVEPRSSS